MSIFFPFPSVFQFPLFPTLRWVPPPPPTTFIKAQFVFSIQFMEECEDQTEWGLSIGKELSGCLNASATWLNTCLSALQPRAPADVWEPWLERVLCISRPRRDAGLGR